MAEPFDGLFDATDPAVAPFDDLFDESPRFSQEQLAAEAERQRTGKRKLFDADQSKDDVIGESKAFAKDLALGAAGAAKSVVPFMDRQSNPGFGEQGTAATAGNVAGGFVRGAATQALGTVLTRGNKLGGSIALAADRALQIGREEGWDTFRKHPIATATDVALSAVPGAAPSFQTGVRGILKPLAIDAATGAGQGGASAIHQGADLSTEEGRAIAAKEALIGGATAAGVTTARTAIPLLKKQLPPGNAPQNVIYRPPPDDSYRARAERMVEAERQVQAELDAEMTPAERYNLPLLEYSGPAARIVDYGDGARSALFSEPAPDPTIQPIAGSATVPLKQSARDVRRSAVEEGMYGYERLPLDSMVQIAKERGISGRDAIQRQWPHLTNEQAKAVRDRVVGRTFGPLASKIESDPEFTPPATPTLTDIEKLRTIREGSYSSYMPNFVPGVGKYPDIPRQTHIDESIPSERQVKPAEQPPNAEPGQVAGAQGSTLPIVQERQGDPSSPELVPTPAQGAADAKYAGGFNKRLFGMEDNPELQSVYEQQAQRMGPIPKGQTKAEVAAEAAKAPGFSIEQLDKIKSYEDAAGLSKVDRQVISGQLRAFADKRLAGQMTPEDRAKFDVVFRAAKFARGSPGSELAHLDQEVVSKMVREGDYKGAALKALDDMDPSGQAPESAIKAIREMDDDPLSMARTVFRESRRYHGFLQNFVTSNLLSNVFGTAPVNMASNIMNLAAETAARQSGTRGTAFAGALRGAKSGAERAGFVAREGFTMEALNDPKLAAKAPGFAAGGMKNPLNWGGRTAFAGDEFIKGMAEQSHTDVLAKAKAMKMAADDLARRTELETELKAKPTPEMLKEAKEFAKDVSYQMEPDEATGFLSGFINWAPIGKGTRAEIKPVKLAVPFFNTVMNVAKANVKLSPVGALAGAFQAARGKITPGQAVTRAAMGLIPTAIGVALAENDILTGPIPDDPGEREAFFEAGKKPWTIRLGDKQIPLTWAGPFALSLGIGAALKEAKRQGSMGKIDDDAANIGLAAALNAFELFMEGSPLISLNSLMETIAKPTEANIRKLSTNVGSSMMPLVSLQGFLNRQNVIPALRDEFVRDKSGQTALEEVLNGIVDRTVAGRKVLPKRLTSFGMEIDRPGQITQSPPDPVFGELYRLGVYPPQASRALPKLPGAVRAEEMTPDEYRGVLKAGQPAYDLIRQHMASEGWQSMDDVQKRLILTTIMGDEGLGELRSAARNQVRAKRFAGAAN